MRLDNLPTSSLRKDIRYHRQRLDELEAEVERRRASGYLQAEKRVTSRQIGGDDGYHHCVLVDGFVKLNGLTKREAEAEKLRLRKELTRAPQMAPTA